MISTYWVGQIPGRPLQITVRGSNGETMDLSGYTQFNVSLIGSNNEDVDLEGSTLQTAGARQGTFLFAWPRDRSLFQTPGEYLLQLELVSNTARDFTTQHHIKVKSRAGGIR